MESTIHVIMLSTLNPRFAQQHLAKQPCEKVGWVNVRGQKRHKTCARHIHLQHAQQHLGWTALPEVRMGKCT
jgi:hypothetical protein